MSTDQPAVSDRSALRSERYQLGMERLLQAVQELSLARELDEVQRIVRTTARALTGCDGATFVLRDDSQCFYADEDAIAPLWKGNRFPMSACISGWAMLHRQTAIIPDIYADARIPHAAYRPTFVKSLVMVPIRRMEPIGAIGNYWAREHRATEDEVRLLQALADSASIAMENVQVYGELEQRVRDRTSALEQANSEILTLSITDELTGLHNRRGFHALARKLLQLARRRRERCLLGFIDVDGLKRVNDQLGHDVGDAMIIDIAQALRRTLRESDLVARMGGDEFCLLSIGPQVDGAALTQRFLAELERINQHEPRAYRLSASVGCVEAAVTAESSLDQLLAQADARMYEAKRAKGGARPS